ncbi:MAG: hypothetical protein FD123_396 [Bacteroidetes bacterium]|nr:MAG: hypothetical protein FD123_396 [Bacteroidota bacterium]
MISLHRAIAIISCCMLFFSCSKDIAFSLEGNCFDFPPSTGPFGYSYQYPASLYLAPCFNPNNSNEFVYVRETKSTGQTELRIKNRSTGNDYLLTTSIFQKPDWGRNGWILFNHGDNNVWKIKSNGDSLTQLTFTSSCFDAVWNYAGDRYVFRRTDGANNYSIIADDEGNPLDTLPGFILSNGSWSNDSQKISSPVSTGPSSNAIISINPNTGQISEVAAIEIGDAKDIISYSDWFPDSQRLLWKTSRSFFITDLPGLQTQIIKTFCDTKLYVVIDISGDGSKIIASRWDQKLIGDNTIFSESNIYIMNADGTGEVKIHF